MLEFNIYRRDSGEVSGFDLGDIQLAFEKDEISSMENSKLSMMIYLTLSLLIYSLLKLKKGRSLKFVAVDSSFSVDFMLEKDKIIISRKKKCFGKYDFNIFLKALDSGIEKFLSAGNNLSEADPAYEDFYNSLQALKSAIN